MAFFLLAPGAASSFDMRTRAGLYTQLIFSGIVMFFAGELAFSNDFSLLLAVYGAIVVSFFAVSFWEDEATKARKVSFSGPVAPVALTSFLSLVLIAASVGAFMLLPWNSAQTPPSERTTFVPFSGEDTPPGVTPEQARQLQDGQGTFGPQSTPQVGEDGLVQIDPSQSTEDGEGAKSEGFFNGTSTDELAALARIGDPLDTSVGDAEGLVMHVRSPIARYWRASAFDTYSPGGVTGLEDAGGWYATYDDDSAYSSFYQGRNNTPEGERYLQTFFINSDVGGEILTGYDPISVLAPRDSALRTVIEEGTTYQVVSRRPVSSPTALRNDRAKWQGPEYVGVPDDFSEVALFTRKLVAGAPTDFDRAAAIASYLGQLELDETAENQLVSSAPLDEFVFGDVPGTSMDFATAMALMGRVAGLPTRLANGYLPGTYNPFSGANTVTQAEAHTWAEVAFEHAGWVPFDAAPRPGGTDAANGGGGSSNPLQTLLANRLGDRIAGEVGGGVGGGVSGLWKLLTNGLIGITVMIIWFAIGVIGWFAWKRWSQSGDGVSSSLRYSIIDGRDRAAILDSHRQVEAMAASTGFRVRRRTESYAEFASAAAAAGLPVPASLRSIAGLAGRAAYSESKLDAGATGIATKRVVEIRQAFKGVTVAEAGEQV
ncbi:MAG: transglutaminase domain-containing protein [Chloroflexi bacterium]|nr:transglutaminase domain-containing protein [Chloroflexota bacterium]